MVCRDLRVSDNKIEIKQFPKMYHPTDDSISIPLFVGGKKIVIEIKTV